MDYKICTSIDQSNKLIELGLAKDTADMCWTQIDQTFVPDVILMDGLKNEYPAWSVSRLLELIELDFSYKIEHDLVICSMTVTQYNDRELTHKIYADNVIDVIFQTMEWILLPNKNKKVNTCKYNPENL